MKMACWFFLCVAAIAASCATGKNGALFPVSQDRKVGYIDQSGKIVINPQFDGVRPFSEGMAAVSLGNKWGYIDKSGKYVINPQFDRVCHFSDGLAPVSLGNKWGYIDKSGKIIINPQFENADTFSEGLAQVYIGNKHGYIDKSGKIVINPQFDGVRPFSQGMAAVSLENKWGYIDKSGKYVINPQFENADAFYEGLAQVYLGGKAVYVDKSGKIVINPQVQTANRFSEGLAAAYFAKGGYIDKSGNFVIKPQFDGVHPFSEGMAAVSLGNKWGYIDKSGKIVINPQFDRADDFSEGLAQVLVAGRFGYIDKRGKYIWNPTSTSSQISSDSTNTPTPEQIQRRVEELQRAKQKQQTPPSPSRENPLSEVQKAAWDHWNGHFTKCGDAYYAVEYESFTPPEKDPSRSLWDPNYHPPKTQRRPRSQYACKLVQITSIRPYELERSDQLEGITGKYGITFEYACKTYFFQVPESVGRWQDWNNTQTFVNKNGKIGWSLRDKFYASQTEQEFLGQTHDGLIKADCSKIIPVQ
jgi:hypothetical protein